MSGSSGAPSARPGREPESAAFETARVVRQRGRPPIFVLGFLMVIAALVVVGVGGRASVAPTLPPVAVDSPAVTAGPSPAPTVPLGAIRPLASFATGPVVRSGLGPVQLEAQRLSASMYIHGDVFVASVTWVYVSLQDDRGRIAGWASVSVPGAAGPARGDGPTLRFDVDVAVPAGFDGPLRINANAYDVDGVLMASTRIDIASLTGSRQEFEP